MTKTIKVALAGAGAFGLRHLDAIKQIDGIETVSLVGRELDKTEEAAAKYGVAHVTTDLADSLKLPGLDAVILATPTQMHAAQALQCLKAGKHVQIEIPLADSLKDAEAVVAEQKRSGLVAMVGHTRRFIPSHQFVRRRILDGDFHIQQMDVQTFFFRRTNMNALGQPRSWTDHLLWHHAAHTVDLFAYQCRSPIVKANALQGPIHPTLGIAMDMSIQLKAENGAICTLSLSFNNEGPLGTFFRYIGDTATYIARYDDLFTGKDEKIDVSQVDVSMNGIELQDREFFAAIREAREPNASVAQAPPCYRVLDETLSDGWGGGRRIVDAIADRVSRGQRPRLQFRRLGEDARDMAHLAPRADLELAIEMQGEIGLGEDVAPVLGVLADQIVHFDPAATHRCAERPAGNGADMLLELRGLRALERPMAGIVDAWRDLVDDKRFVAVMVAGDEHLDRQHADIVERANHGSGDALGLRRRLRADARGRARASQDVALVLVLAEVVSHDLAFQAARRDH